MNQFMQMAFTAFMMYDSRSANPSMFPTLSENNDDKSDKTLVVNKDIKINLNWIFKTN
jgi:hypothetical protein